jgi:hypothetical protein
VTVGEAGEEDEDLLAALGDREGFCHGGRMDRDSETAPV